MSTLTNFYALPHSILGEILLFLPSKDQKSFRLINLKCKETYENQFKEQMKTLHLWRELHRAEGSWERTTQNEATRIAYDGRIYSCKVGGNGDCSIFRHASDGSNTLLMQAKVVAKPLFCIGKHQNQRPVAIHLNTPQNHEIWAIDENDQANCIFSCKRENEAMWTPQHVGSGVITYITSNEFWAYYPQDEKCYKIPPHATRWTYAFKGILSNEEGTLFYFYNNKNGNGFLINRYGLEASGGQLEKKDFEANSDDVIHTVSSYLLDDKHLFVGTNFGSIFVFEEKTLSHLTTLHYQDSAVIKELRLIGDKLLATFHSIEVSGFIFTKTIYRIGYMLWERKIASQTKQGSLSAISWEVTKSSSKRFAALKSSLTFDKDKQTIVFLLPFEKNWKIVHLAPGLFKAPSAIKQIDCPASSDIEEIDYTSLEVIAGDNQLFLFYKNEDKRILDIWKPLKR